MTKKNTAALYAARWVDQRLRELVVHWRPTMEAISEAHREVAQATATDPRDFMFKRRLLATEIAQMRGDMLREADKLLKLRQKVTPQAGAFPQEPPEVLAELKRLRRAHDEYLAERRADEEWFDNVWDYSMECSRCQHDGDVMPNPADYGLDPAAYGIVDKPPEGAEVVE
ncbi:MAG: hypothetical protein HQ464_08870 [Planctomycetes bacterium]|nr:hypothetical protein [Planctomycetota bacterium]